jgi:hypothetical protein
MRAISVRGVDLRQGTKILAHPCYSSGLAMEAAVNDQFPMPEIDENGVDRSQIRALLRLTPVERLRQAEQFMEETMKLWEQNGIRPLR